MQVQDESFSLLTDYLGFNGRRLLFFLALVAGVVVVVTGIYVAIFGYDNWSNNMQQAGNMMLANAGPGATAVQPRMVQPRRTPVPVHPQLRAQTQVPATQYVCPQCGTTGLPRWTAGGTPQCPVCGGTMIPAGQTRLRPQLVAQP